MYWKWKTHSLVFAVPFYIRFDFGHSTPKMCNDCQVKADWCLFVHLLVVGVLISSKLTTHLYAHFEFVHFWEQSVGETVENAACICLALWKVPNWTKVRSTFQLCTNWRVHGNPRAGKVNKTLAKQKECEAGGWNGRAFLLSWIGFAFD